jgi:hypothetical protein
MPEGALLDTSFFIRLDIKKAQFLVELGFFFNIYF